MRIDRLQAFLAVAETGSFQKASKRCGLSQSTISRQIQALETELGLPLLYRNGEAKLTIGGSRLLPRAKKICQEWDCTQNELADLLAGKQPELCVAAIHSVCAHFLPPVLREFCLSHPEVQLRVTALGSDRALKVLRDGMVDLAIVMNNRLLTGSSNLHIESLYDEPIEILMFDRHPLAAWEVVPWEEMAKYPQAVFKDGYGMQRLVQEQFVRMGVKLNAALELNTLDAFRGVVKQGDLIALLPRSALLDCTLDPTLAIRPLLPPPESECSLTREVVLVTTPDRLVIPPIATFCQLLISSISL
jgi:DNA-binding transcriptional LysR family regulator